MESVKVANIADTHIALKGLLLKSHGQRNKAELAPRGALYEEFRAVAAIIDSFHPPDLFQERSEFCMKCAINVSCCVGRLGMGDRNSLSYQRR
ncbi:uncharacterized protein PHALS_12212 [Plasmopara halstedii]|uniref:Uncharacterized protein n=1 Tax=Plasmopara halstedii TaxID=4781 RepID=A0A0P1AKU6_PLAHL|nr:uncharacterized protein PHALS_12212 [Plasmopara halstedii]CEG41898.1 hypothetical protein PHALS_12212 [Plasmopara halstedii]|eukprot:XP_024578267.1 hypothetical protein PHALS_12212 [Plasmopara halstedii]